MKSNGTKYLMFLSWFPLTLAIGILIGVLVKWQRLLDFLFGFYGMVLIFVIPVWLFLIIYLRIKEKITIKQCLIYILIFVFGFIAVEYIIDHDIFSSGLKWRD